MSLTFRSQDDRVRAIKILLGLCDRAHLWGKERPSQTLLDWMTHDPHHIPLASSAVSIVQTAWGVWSNTEYFPNIFYTSSTELLPVLGKLLACGDGRFAQEAWFSAYGYYADQVHGYVPGGVTYAEGDEP